MNSTIKDFKNELNDNLDTFCKYKILHEEIDKMCDILGFFYEKILVYTSKICNNSNLYFFENNLNEKTEPIYKFFYYNFQEIFNKYINSHPHQNIFNVLNIFTPNGMTVYKTGNYEIYLKSLNIKTYSQEIYGSLQIIHNNKITNIITGESLYYIYNTRTFIEDLKKFGLEYNETILIKKYRNIAKLISISYDIIKNINEINFMNNN